MTPDTDNSEREATRLHGFEREDLEAIAEGLEERPATINIGNVTGEGDEFLQTLEAAAARFIRAALASRPAVPQPVALSDERIDAEWKTLAIWGEKERVRRFARLIALAAASPPPAAERGEARWISVEEQLPTPEEDVLLWLGPERPPVVAAIFPEIQDRWTSYESRGYGPEATHWMPLPPPPGSDPSPAPAAPQGLSEEQLVQAVLDERIDSPDNDEDRAYNTALLHAADAVRAALAATQGPK